MNYAQNPTTFWDEKKRQHRRTTVRRQFVQLIYTVSVTPVSRLAEMLAISESSDTPAVLFKPSMPDDALEDLDRSLGIIAVLIQYIPCTEPRRAMTPSFESTAMSTLVGKVVRLCYIASFLSTSCRELNSQAKVLSFRLHNVAMCQCGTVA